MEPPNLLENEKHPQERKSTFFQVAFYTFIFVLIIISGLVSIVFCLLHHNQAPDLCWAHGLITASSKPKGLISWKWKLEHCDGFVEEDHGQYLRIQQSGRYFIYAQINRIQKMDDAFTLMMYKSPEILLNKVVGPRDQDNASTISFGRPFYLNKGDKLFCRINFSLDKVLTGNESYWGLYKM